MASDKFARGPAREIKAESRRGFFKLYGSKTTGFAHPKGITGIPIDLKITRTSKRVVPIGS